MRTRSSSHLIGESFTTLKRRNRRRSKKRVEPFSLEETSVVTTADQRTMAKLLQAPTEGYEDAIVIPAILAENFELKHGLLNLVTSKQFYGFEKEDPHAHIRWFNKITSTIKYKDVPNSSIKLMLFHFLSRKQPGFGSKKKPLDLFLLGKILFPSSLTNSFLLPKLQISEMKLQIFNKSLRKRYVRHGTVSRISFVHAHITACPSEMAALTDAINVMLRHVKTSPPKTVKAIFEIYVTCGGPHPYHECLAADGNTFNASAATATYNQNQGYHPQRDPNYRASNQMGPPGFPPVQNNQSRFNQNQGSLPSNTVADPRGDLKAITT
ncbi:hypothetical protein Tco_0047031 [Tanacetum coccineum]